MREDPETGGPLPPDVGGYRPGDNPPGRRAGGASDGNLSRAYAGLEEIYVIAVEVTGPLNKAMEIIETMEGLAIAVIADGAGLPSEAAAMRGRIRALIAGIESALADAVETQALARTLMQRIHGGS